MQNIDTMKLIKQGQWFHAGLTSCPVRIVQHTMLHGTHDPEDPPELAADIQADCFYVYFCLPQTPDDWCEGGAALSLREAIFLAQRKLGSSLQWD
jgi:hypothetical protein